MSRKLKGLKRLEHDVRNSNYEKYHAGVGTSKHEDKQQLAKDTAGNTIIGKNGKEKRVSQATAFKGKIYSEGTLGNYIAKGNLFVKWCNDEFGCTSLAECRDYIEAYIWKSDLDALVDAGAAIYLG